MPDTCPEMDTAHDHTCLGEYRLRQLLSENTRTRIWLAEQESISRQVLVDELKPELLDQKEAFLADVRAKAAVDHPLISSVYEAVDTPEHCFAVHEMLHGAPLDQSLQSGSTLPPEQLAHMLHQVAVAQLHHQTAGHATSPLHLRNLHLDEHGVVRLDNLAVAGTRSPDESARDIAYLGEALRPLVAPGQPGSTRAITLLSWMRGEGLETALDWQQVSELCTQIEQQLSHASPTPTKQADARGKRSHRKSRLPIALAAVLALIAILIVLMRMGPDKPGPTPRPAMPTSILVPPGIHPAPDGGEHELNAFRICPHEVTIGDYAAFLDTLSTLTKSGLERTFDHAQQPAEKISHQPDDWASLLAAAKSTGVWNQRQVTLDTPVVGVDWWDAAAYAEWKKARLPSQDEWFAAMRREVANPSAIQPAEWLPVTAETADRTPGGMLFMAGSVCEWTSQAAINPSNPLGERQWVIIGGSFLKPGSNALSREWTNDRSLRRADLGFRIVWDVP